MNAEEAEEAIESAEESGDVNRLLSIIKISTQHGGDPEESDEAEEWETSAEAVLDAFYRLIKGGGAPPPASLIILWENLTKWISCEAIVEVCLGCIVAVSNSSSKSIDETGINDLDAKFIITVMQKYEEEGTIQEQACLAIEGMATSSNNLKEKLACEEVKGELIAAKDRISNERNKKYPGLAAIALGMEL